MRRPTNGFLPRVLQWLATPEKLGYHGVGCTGRDARRLFTCLRRGEPLFDGPYVRAYEEALRSYYGGREAIAFGGARMALYAILKTMGLREGDEVILPGYNCIVIPNALLRLGLKPVYVDVSRDDYNIIPELAARAITPRTRAILAQHTFGIACDMAALMDVARRFGLPLIEDGAHAIGARLDGRLLGTYGDAGFFSTQETKVITTGHGGYAVTGDREWAGRIRAVQEEAGNMSADMARAGAYRWCYLAAVGHQPGWHHAVRLFELAALRLGVPGLRDILAWAVAQYNAEMANESYVPYPTRLPDLMGLAGLWQLQRLEDELAHRRALAPLLEGALPALGAVVPRYDHRRVQPSWVRFPFVVRERGPWMAAARRSAFTLGVWLDDPIHPRGSNWQRLGYARGMCPNAEYLSDHILNIPIDSRVSRAHIRHWLALCRARWPVIPGSDMAGTQRSHTAARGSDEVISRCQE